MKPLSALFLKEIVDYDFNSGDFRWLVRHESHFKSPRDHKIWNTKNAGNIIKNPDSAGYLYLNLAGKRYPLHRLAWLYHYGDCVPMIDHINGITSDNRIANLRPASSLQNNRNRRPTGSSESRFKGVYFSKQKNKWISNIRTGKRRVHLGSFSSDIDAAKAYDVAALKYHGKFALTNKMMGLL